MRHHLLNADRGAHRVPRVIGIGERGVEADQHGIALVGDQHAIVAGDHFRYRREVLVQRLHQRIRAEPLSDRREAFDVAEENAGGKHFAIARLDRSLRGADLTGHFARHEAGEVVGDGGVGDRLHQQASGANDRHREHGGDDENAEDLVDLGADQDAVRGEIEGEVVSNRRGQRLAR